MERDKQPKQTDWKAARAAACAHAIGCHGKTARTDTMCTARCRNPDCTTTVASYVECVSKALWGSPREERLTWACLLYTSDAADDM
eukprot:9204123-Alexandrium_andersonii.AAC.1